jgi:predicted ATP-dependent endonuclease of OLD family
MLIKKLEVKNFRSIQKGCLGCDNVTALLGRNGSGKSSFLYALETFYNVAAPVSIEDFFNHDTDSPIEIRLTYGDLRSDEQQTFRSYISDNLLIVTKRISYENGKFVQRYYAAVLQIPKFAEIRAKSGKTERRTAWNQLVDSPGDLVDLGEKAKSADEADRYMDEYESRHPGLMVPFEKEQQFFGPKNIGGGKLDKFTRYVLIPAVREASDEASGKKGAIYQILDMIVLRKIEARRDIQAFKADFEEKAKKLYSSENLTELRVLGASISETLSRFAPGSYLKLDWDEFEPPQVQTPAAIPTLIEDNFEGEISRKGHGLQRALILTLLQHLAMIAPKETINGEPSQEIASSFPESHVPSPGPDLILAIEEPELYLHPSRCRYLCELLVQLAENPGRGLGSRNQIIYTTHSPYLVNLHRFDKIRVIRKKPSQECPIPNSSVTRFTFDECAKELARICNANPADFTRESVQARATSIMNTIVNEGFFSDVVLIVEGPSDVGILWKLQEIMNKQWAELGIVVVPAGGKNNIDRPTVVFRGLSIPTYFIFDGDASHKGKGDDKEKDAIRRNHRYLCLAGVAPEDFPKTQIDKNWAVFEENLEKELEKALGSKDFQVIRTQIASELGYPEAAQAIKNIEGAARFIEVVYQNRKRVPVLEEIIERVTLLRQ